MATRAMPRDTHPADWLAGLTSRRDALRAARQAPGADPEVLLESALTELDGAVEVIADLVPGPAGDGSGAPPAGASAGAERRLLRDLFQRAPAPLLLLEPDSTIRRANDGVAGLLGSPASYATGKALTGFIDLPYRAAVLTDLAAAARTGDTRQVRCRVLAEGGPVEATLTAAPVGVAVSQQLLVAALVPLAAGRPAVAGREPAERVPGSGQGMGARRSSLQAMTRRTDMIMALTRVLLDNAAFSEAVSVQRSARLLAGEMASWVIADVERDGVLRRQFVAGPRDARSVSVARRMRHTDPWPGSAPCQAHATGNPVLLAHTADGDMLGKTPGGGQLLMELGATSLLSVPISDGRARYGALTLARAPGEGRFEVADLAVMEEIGRHLAVAIRVDRMFRRRSETAETLRASLLPAELPATPGLECAAAYLGAARSQEVSGDFYDISRCRGGWAVAVGDVCGKGEEAAAVTAAARHAIRAFALHGADPADVLSKANELLLAGGYGERFVTAQVAMLRRRGRRTRVRLGGCGHPGPALVRADGRVEMLEGGGLPLGLFDDARPGHADLELAEGDLLLFYTDGITELREAGPARVEDRLADELAATAGGPAAQAVRAVQDFVIELSGGDLRDDATILAVKAVAAPARADRAP